MSEADKKLAAEIVQPTLDCDFCLTCPDDVAQMITAIAEALSSQREADAQKVKGFTNWARWLDGDISPAPSLDRIADLIRQE